MKLALVMSLCLGAACASPVTERGCEGTVMSEIAKVGVARDQISSLTISPQTQSDEDHRTVGYTYWMRLKSCRSGYLIVDTTNFCYIEQVYTTGECRVSGVKHY